MTDPARLARIFEDAVELTGGERRVFLDEACGSDDQLRAEVESLLHADDSAGSFFEPAGDAGQPDPLIGSEVGPWRLIRLIATGGMGRVYLAERADGAFEMQVAVKLIRAGLDTAELLARFEQERHVLARLQHPNIAALIDGGATEQGTPYLVMEYVEGQPIDRYCDAGQLGLRERLRLFRQICQAVQRAHQNLVVHRDIKPSNVLVTEDGSVKLLDFGIAKMLDSEDRRSLTQTGTRALTPRYASPEQIRNETVATASDVYSLGVVLFELITGGRPYGTERLSPHEAEKLVVERVPTRPSEAVTESEVARREGGTRQLARRLNGDLDNIVLKALRKEQERRYASVEQLAEDIRRHLEGFPVEARPDTFAYRASRFAMRNRKLLAAGIALAVALVSGTAVSIHYALEERRQRGLAESRYEQVRELATLFLTEVDGAIVGEGKTAAREKIVSTSLAYLDRLAGESGDDATLLRDAARGYFRVAMIQGDPKSPSLGDTAAALASASKGQQLAERLAQLEPEEARSMLVGVEGHLLAGDLSRHLGDASATFEHFRAALAARERIAVDDMAEPRLDTAHFRLGYALERFGLNEEAVEHFERAREIGARLMREHPDEPRLFQDFAVTSIALSQAQRFGGRPEKALELLPPLAERLSEQSVNYPELRPTLANLRYNLGWLYVDQGDVTRGIAEIEGTVAFYRDLARDDPDDITAHRNVASGLHDLGELEHGAGRTDTGLRHYEEMVTFRRRITERSPASTLYRSDLAASLMAWGDLLEQTLRSSDAEELFVEAAEVFEQLAAEHPQSDEYRRNAAEARRRVGSASPHS